MVWDNWNPVKDVRDDWGDSLNVWGKLKVFVFYVFVWAVFAGNVYQVFVPLSGGYECLADGAVNTAAASISLLLRQWAFYICALMLYVAKDKATFSNMRAVVAIMVIGCVMGYFYHSGMDDECYSSIFGMWLIFVCIPVVAMAFAYIERRVGGGGSGGESQPLV